MANEKVIIYIKGGNVQNIVGTPNVQVKIVDYDNNSNQTEKELEYYEPDICLPIDEIDNFKIE